MAVYKATYCNPMLSNLDIRVASTGEFSQPCEWLTCKIDSSNKKITGYKIRILDSANNQIFPSEDSNEGKGHISPITELPQEDDLYTGFNVNSGYNGTILKIPFFQNYTYTSSSETQNQMKLPSFNAVYYTPCYRVDYNIIQGESATVSFEAVDSDTINISGEYAMVVDSETLEIGDTILIKDDVGVCEKGIFKVTQITTTPTPTVKIERVNHIGVTALTGKRVVITKGEIYHNAVFLYDATWQQVTNREIFWKDIEGNSINLDVKGGSYKWEITLYQGDGTESYTTITLAGGSVQVGDVDYSGLDYDWFDTTLNSGKILGSTNKRIQIASYLDDVAVVPVSDSNTPLVLQGTYAQLLLIDPTSETYDPQPIGNRAYVQNYDSTFGHVYPINGGFSREDIAAATNICFYKHSNNAEEVLARERVDCATVEGVNLNLYIEEGGQWKLNPSLGLPVIDGIQLKEGDYVLVKDQEKQYENGVYVAHATGTAWSRSGSYKNWGEYIGAILFVMNGSVNGSTNWESTAGAGGTLFNGGSSTGSLLIFIPERPITLLPVSETVDLIRQLTPEDQYNSQWGDEIIEPGNPCTIKVLYSNPTSPYASDVTRCQSDGINFHKGQTILCTHSRQVIEITDASPYVEMVMVDHHIAWRRGYTITYSVIKSVSLGSRFNVTSGQKYGGQVVVLVEPEDDEDDGINIAYGVKDAFILRNTTTRTYITPYNSLKEDMVLKLLNNKKVTYNNLTSSEWIKVKSVNTITWSIDHNQLTTPMQSDSPVDSSIPYSYEIKTYYRASDENSFFTCEQPYLKIELVSIHPYSNIPERYATLKGFYYQFQQASWESYRWVLLNYNAQNQTWETVQDTGLKYEKAIQVTFYGLNNESGHNQYKAILYVTDDKKNTISAERQFSVQSPIEPIPSGINEFKADFDCSTHSFVLSCTGSSGEYSVYRREYRTYHKVTAPSEYKIVQGSWKPVALKINYSQFPIRDFNIKAGESYQYVIYPANSALAENVFANVATKGPYTGTGAPKEAHWDEWSLIELKPVENVVDAPILRKTFIADLDNIWLFKYGLEIGNQTQNIQKSDIQTLGRYSKIGYGRANSISGDVSCYLGSEIVPYSAEGYIERMRKSINTPLSTNEKALMLQKWRDFVFSPNPKLLRDIKGQSWIVQIMSSSNSPKNFYYNQPDTISFSWKQIDDTDGVVIIGSGEALPEVGCYDSVWKKVEAE